MGSYTFMCQIPSWAWNGISVYTPIVSYDHSPAYMYGDVSYNGQVSLDVPSSGLELKLGYGDGNYAKTINGQGQWFDKDSPTVFYGDPLELVYYPYFNGTQGGNMYAYCSDNTDNIVWGGYSFVGGSSSCGWIS